MPTWGNYYWPYYLVLASALFLIPELIGVATNAANTLSEYAWRQLHVGLAFSPAGIHTLAWWLSIVAWLMFTVIITAHIWWRVLP